MFQQSPGLSTLISDSSQAGGARRSATVLAQRAGFDESGWSNIAIAVTELAMNLLRHAQRGEIVLQLFSGPGGEGLDVLSLDKGPGIDDVGKALQDGFSSIGGRGTGLGAVSRLSHQFEVYSRPHVGTAILSRFWRNGPPGPAGRGPDRPLQFGCLAMPMRGESVCGDACSTAEVNGCSLIIVADGLGHGPDAAQSSAEAIHAFHDELRAPFDFQSFFERAHRRLLKTRGSAVAVAEINPAAGVVRYGGVGNISGSIITEEGKNDHRMVSHNGIVGRELRKVQEFSYRWGSRFLLMMYSDGLQSAAAIDDYPGLASRDPVLIAGVMHRDFQRGRDDATVVVAKAT